MCTGDNIDTATAISINAGIINEADVTKPYACMTGMDFREAVGPVIQIEDPKNPE